MPPSRSKSPNIRNTRKVSKRNARSSFAPEAPDRWPRLDASCAIFVSSIGSFTSGTTGSARSIASRVVLSPTYGWSATKPFTMSWLGLLPKYNMPWSVRIVCKALMDFVGSK